LALKFGVDCKSHVVEYTILINKTFEYSCGRNRDLMIGEIGGATVRKRKKEGAEKFRK